MGMCVVRMTTLGVGINEPASIKFRSNSKYPFYLLFLAVWVERFSLRKNKQNTFSFRHLSRMYSFIQSFIQPVYKG